jgi:hypothetical protein
VVALLSSTRRRCQYSAVWTSVGAHALNSSRISKYPDSCIELLNAVIPSHMVADPSWWACSDAHIPP